MSAFFDFILATYVGGLIWIGIGLVLIFSVKKINDWRKNRTDGERFIKFAGICFVIFGVFVIINLIYIHFTKHKKMGQESSFIKKNEFVFVIKKKYQSSGIN